LFWYFWLLAEKFTDCPKRLIYPTRGCSLSGSYA